MKGFYKLQIKNDETKVNHVDEVIGDSRITSHIDFAGPGFEKLNKGDIVLVHKGSYPYCLVEVLYKISDIKEITGTSFGIDYRVKVKSLFSELDGNLDFKKQNKQIGYDGTFIPLYDNKSKTFLFMKSWNTYIQKNEEMTNLKNILAYKKQIILQGPPGTGKTKLAKEIAKEILNANSKDLTPLQVVENFFKEGKSNVDYNVNFKDRLQEFYSLFPKEEIINLELDDYCIGRGNRTNFCWWIEVGLSKFGKFSPGQSGNYVIYFSKKVDNYIVRADEQKDDLFDRMKITLSNLVIKENFKNAAEYFGDSFVIKILNSYYPERYFPINGRNGLVNAMKLFNRDFKKVPTIELNQNLQDIFQQYKNKFPSDITSLDFMAFLYRHFDLNKSGDLYELNSGKENERKPVIIQFHPSYTYEDFVRGITAKSTGKGIEYKTENKILAQLAKEAEENEFSEYVLIIDEINRANLSSVLGELIYALEYRSEVVNSTYSLLDDNGEESNELILPPNLYIIGTMNTADRSVGHIDYAIRRRFAFVEILPEALIDNDEIYFNLEGFNTVSAIFNRENVSNEFEIKDVQIGHSYFIAKKSEAKNETERDEIFKMKMEYEVVPILEEYVKDGILINDFGGKPIKEYILTFKP